MLRDTSALAPVTVNFDQTIGELQFDTVSQLAGTWGSTLSTATFKNDNWFSGTGVITVVPEPSSLLLLGAGLGFLLGRREIRRKDGEKSLI